MPNSTEAARSLKTHAIGDIIARMQGMSHDDLSKLYDSLMSVPNAAAQNPDNSEKNKQSVAMKVVKEDVAALFGEDAAQLGEEFINDATMIIESAINIRVAELEEQLTEQASEVVAEAVQAKADELTDILDQYLDEVITEWMEENKLAIESSVKVAQFDSFMDGLRGLFESHDIDIPEESLDLVDTLTAEVAELKEQFNKEHTARVEAEELVEELVKDNLIEQASKGLPEINKEKMKQLAEGIEFENVEDYERKLVLLRKAHFSANGKEEVLREEFADIDEVIETEEPVKPVVSNRYVEAISRDLRK